MAKSEREEALDEMLVAAAPLPRVGVPDNAPLAFAADTTLIGLLLYAVRAMEQLAIDGVATPNVDAALGALKIDVERGAKRLAMASYYADKVRGYL